MNSALEDDHRTEHQFQYERPPIVDTVNNTPSLKQAKDDAQQPSYIQNETAYSTTTSVSTPIEQRTNERLSSTPAPVIVEKANVPEEVKPSIQVKTNEQHVTDPTQAKVVKEDILVVHRETASTTQSHQQEETLYLSKTVTEQILPSSDQQQPINETSQKPKQTADLKSTPPTPVRVDQAQQQPTLEVAKTNHSADSDAQPAKKLETVQNSISINNESNQQKIPSESLENIRSPDLHLEPLKVPHVEIKKNLEDSKQPKPTTETVKNTDSIDAKVPSDQPATTVQTPKIVETIPTDVKTEDTVVQPKKPPSLGRTTVPPSRVIRPPTSRIQQKAQARQRQAQHKSSEPQSTSNTGK